MCGICGRVNFDGLVVEEALIHDMMGAIKHRGPDDEGVFIDDNVGLGHVRLSILDLSTSGHQPMYSADKRYLIVFNGEIYNYLELKKELSGDYNFSTKTDTEVILAAYLKWGKDCLNHFNGDWAFVVYDLEQKTIFGSRDRYGIKPFYYLHEKGMHFTFASELKALTKIQSLEANRELLYDYLVYNRTDHTEGTFFKNVNRLQAGHMFTISKGELKIEKWYDIEEKLEQHRDLGLEENSKEFLRLFEDAIRIRLRSDVPVGVCLSGGLDSSSIVSMLIEMNEKSSLNTFSAVFKGFEHADESKFIEMYTPSLDNMHYTSPGADEFWLDYENFIRSHAEPIPGVTPYTQYKVMELASQSVKVTLDGQGADEYLAGYHYFFGAYFKELLNSVRLTSLMSELGHYWLNHKSLEGYKYWLYYMLPNRVKSFASRKVYGNISSDFHKEFGMDSNIQEDLYNPTTLNNSLIQHFKYKLEHLLKWEDLNAMNFSIESRVPFLDHRLVEFMLSLKPQNAISKGQTKFLLRKSLKGILPDPIRNRKDKKGFSTPADFWFRDQRFSHLINDIISSNDFRNRGIFNAKECQKSYEKHLKGQENNTKDIWKWINTELWFKNFIDN